MSDIQTFYKSNLLTLGDEEKTQKRRLRLLGLIRLLLFIGLLLTIFILIPKATFFGIVILGLCIVLFLLVVKKHNLQKNRHQHTVVLISINENELKALDYDFSGFETGAEFLDHEHSYSFDMDLFGEGSVFQYLNRTVTIKGKILFSGFLSSGTSDQTMILSRQESVKELSGMIEFMQNFRAVGLLHKDNTSDIDSLRQWINKPVRFLSRRAFVFISNVFPIALLLSILLAFFFPDFKGISILIFLFNLIIVGSQFQYSSKEHGQISKRLETLKKYALLLAIIERSTFSGNKLKTLYKTLISGRFSAAKSILNLSKIVSSFDNRMNIIAAIFLEGFFLWDIRCILKLEKWRRDQGTHFDEWMRSLAEFDAMISLSTFAFNHPDYVFPEFSKKTILAAEHLGHFLIPSDNRVCNNFGINKKGEFTIITGANMAGKSTFLRTVAINLVMAMTGAPVCAKRFDFKPMSIFSSMRTSDSLSRNESYFYAELKRLKEMLDKLKMGDELFIILDEILKGTNSTDKQKGSQSVLKQILKFNGTGIIATHDLELANIEKAYPERIRNLCFEIEIDKTNILFDYKLREGITTKMNALLLMQQMGILDK